MFFHPKNLKSENNKPWFKPWFNILMHTQSIVCATVDRQCLEYLGYTYNFDIITKSNLLYMRAHVCLTYDILGQVTWFQTAFNFFSTKTDFLLPCTKQQKINLLWKLEGPVINFLKKIGYT